jgi:CheY-like chemotaxis protein
MARVLVAEDDPDMRQLVVDALRKGGHDVQQAIDGSHLLSNRHTASNHALQRERSSARIVSFRHGGWK